MFTAISTTGFEEWPEKRGVRHFLNEAQIARSQFAVC
jgi:hypothetical protein